MSFFKKLKSRLTRSSSKLEQGLEDIVAENAASEDEVAQTPEPSAPATPAETSPEAAPQTRAEPPPEL
ncbi:MAG: signal recognition particle-docking protein FtsY, partial [Thioclava sp.]